MGEHTLLCWREAFQVCMREAEMDPLARHLAKLSEADRAMLLDGISSEVLKAAVDSVLRREQQQLALA